EAEERGRAQLASVGAADWSPRLLGAVFWNWVELNGPHVDGAARVVDEELLSETSALADNYLTWLLGVGIDRLRTEAYPGGRPPNALLYLLLRHSVLLALLDAADAASGDVAQPEDAAVAVEKEAWREPELVAVEVDTQTALVWDRAATLVSVGGESMTAS